MKIRSPIYLIIVFICICFGCSPRVVTGGGLFVNDESIKHIIISPIDFKEDSLDGRISAINNRLIEMNYGGRIKLSAESQLEASGIVLPEWRSTSASLFSIIVEICARRRIGFRFANGNVELYYIKFDQAIPKNPNNNSDDIF